MKRSEMIQIIASDLVHEYTNFMPFDKVQELAEIVLKRIEGEGMLPPFYHKQVPNLVDAMNEFPEQFFDWENE